MPAEQAVQLDAPVEGWKVPTEQLAQTVERVQETTYGEFVTFVRQELSKNSKSLEPQGLQKQLDALQQSMDATQRVRSAKELQVLREWLGRLGLPRMT